MKIKKAETPGSSPNVPTIALGSTYFQKSTHEVKAGHTLRHQGLKLTTFSWLPFPQILHPWCLLPNLCSAYEFVLFLFPQAER